MNIRMLSLALVAMCGTACAVQDSSPQTSQLSADQQDVESPSCGMVCVPQTQLLDLHDGALGPDCNTAYATATSEMRSQLIVDCQDDGYNRACNVATTPYSCSWDAAAGQYYGIVTLTQYGCADSTC